MARVPFLFRAAGCLAVSIMLVLPWLGQTPLPLKVSERDTPTRLDERPRKHGDIIAGRYIVQYHVPADNNLFARSHDDLINALQSRGVQASVETRFDDKGFHAAILSIPEEDDDASHVHFLRSLDHVMKVEPSRVVSMDAFSSPSRRHDTQHSRRGSATASANIDTMANASIPLAPQPALQKRIDGYTETNVDLIHKQTAVSAFHEQEIKGQGVTLVILSGAVDVYQLKNIGDDYTIKFGQNYVGTRLADGRDAIDTSNIWGAATKCGKTLGTALVKTIGDDQIGVAPKARIGVYRVFDCDGQTSIDILLTALRDAAVAGARVVLSPIDMNKEALAELLSQQISAMPNTNVVTAAMEDLSHGLFSSNNAAKSIPDLITVTNAEANLHTISVLKTKWFRPSDRGIAREHGRPVDVIMTNFNTFNDDGPENALRQFTIVFLPHLDVADLSICAEDYELPYSQGHDVLLLPDHKCVHEDAYSEKVHLRGFQRVLYSTMSLDPQGHLIAARKDIVPFRAYIDDFTVGAMRRGSLRASIILDLSESLISRVYAPEQPVWSIEKTSALGPALGIQAMSPTIAGPGEVVYWAANRAHGDIYGSEISAAYVAGCVALMASYQPELTPSAVMNKLISGATPLYHSGHPLSVAQQGAGLVNLLTSLLKIPTPGPDQVPTPAYSNPAFVAFGDKAYHGGLDRWFDLDICNSIHDAAPDDTSFQVWVEKATTMYGLAPDPTYLSPEIDLYIYPPQIDIPYGACQTVQIKVGDYPQDLATDRIPVFSGYLMIHHTNWDFRTPYVGIGTEMATVDPIIESQTKFYRWGQAVDDVYNFFALDDDRNTKENIDKSPCIGIAFVYPPYQVRIGVFTAPDDGQPALVQTLFDAYGPSMRDLEEQAFVWNGVDFQGRNAGPGKYQFYIRALGRKGDQQMFEQSKVFYIT